MPKYLVQVEARYEIECDNEIKARAAAILMIYQISPLESIQEVVGCTIDIRGAEILNVTKED